MKTTIEHLDGVVKQITPRALFDGRNPRDPVVDVLRSSKISSLGDLNPGNSYRRMVHFFRKLCHSE